LIGDFTAKKLIFNNIFIIFTRFKKIFSNNFKFFCILLTFTTNYVKIYSIVGILVSFVKGHALRNIAAG